MIGEKQGMEETSMGTSARVRKPKLQLTKSKRERTKFLKPEMKGDSTTHPTYLKDNKYSEQLYSYEFNNLDKIDQIL